MLSGKVETCGLRRATRWLQRLHDRVIVPLVEAPFVAARAMGVMSTTFDSKMRCGDLATSRLLREWDCRDRQEQPASTSFQALVLREGA